MPEFRPKAPNLSVRVAAGGRELALEARGDSSVYGLIAANVFAIAVAVVTGMGLRDMMLVYWIQSLIIGASFVIRIMALRGFSGRLAVGGEPFDGSIGHKLSTSLKFAAIYGLFHAGYLAVIVSDVDPGRDLGTISGYLLCALGFALAHAYSLFHNIVRERNASPDVHLLVMLPFWRVLPMHAIVFIGGSAGFASPVAFYGFAVLKLVADVAMHAVEHHVLQRTDHKADSDSGH